MSVQLTRLASDLADTLTRYTETLVTYERSVLVATRRFDDLGVAGSPVPAPSPVEGAVRVLRSVADGEPADDQPAGDQLAGDRDADLGRELAGAEPDRTHLDRTHLDRSQPDRSHPDHVQPTDGRRTGELPVPGPVVAASSLPAVAVPLTDRPAVPAPARHAASWPGIGS